MSNVDTLFLWAFVGIILFILCVWNFMMKGEKPPFWFMIAAIFFAGPGVWIVFLTMIGRRLFFTRH